MGQPYRAEKRRQGPGGMAGLGLWVFFLPSRIYVTRSGGHRVSRFVLSTQFYPS